MAKAYEHEKTFTFEGKRYRVRANSETDLAVKVAIKKKELQEGSKAITKGMDFRSWANKWLEVYKEGTVGDKWLKNIKSIMVSIILPEIGSMPVRSIKSIHIKKLLNSCEGKSRSYVTKVYNILNECFQEAKRNGLCLENPAEDVPLPKVAKKKKRRAITPYEREHILNLCKTHRAGLFLKFMLYCGLRPGEVSALRWCDIDLQNRNICVTRARKSDGSIGDTKTESGNRIVPIPNDFAEDLTAMKPRNTLALVCTQKSGSMHTDTSIRQMWNSFIYRLNIEMGCKTFKGKLMPPYRVADDLVMYCLRHTYCTDLQAAGVPINVAKELMGHSDISTTAEIYTHGSEESLSHASEAINSLWKARA